ncbi:PH domain-containing protein [Halopiger goleimassiliensis]|uniref:PH domain-containing protein n=1 Tax=Halopiger goleimassiliensis TaxID=1293048 RepID=UPI00067801E6|nr:PH domain-containing protein [Halopiger goleimassiliensis]
MGLFDVDENVHLENADLDCEPQNEFANKKEVKRIDKYLDPGEKVHFLARSAGEQFEIDGDDVDDVLAQRTAATDKRIVVKKKKNPFGYESQSIRYENISSVNLSTGLVKKKLRIETASKVYGIGVGKLSDDAAEAMCDFVRTKMSKAQGSDSESGANEDDPLDKLERLGDLKEDGAISEAEFEEKKAELLEQI